MAPGSVLNRYLPFLALAALQVVLVTVQPSGAPTPTAGGGLVGRGTYSHLDEAPAAVADTRPAAARLPVSAQPDETAAQSAATATAAAAQPVDALGRPLAGDKTKCAADGLVQQAVTRLSVPCIPRFVGDNGGATSQGVTEKEIIGVYYQPKLSAAAQAALSTQEISMSPEEVRENLELNERFMNKHYEFYGRRFKWIQYDGTCEGNDPSCYRIDAKTIYEKHRPFIFVHWVAGAQPGGGPEPLSDELMRRGVVVIGVSFANSNEWFAAHAPYVWNWFTSGSTVLESGADFYCKKMWEKNATLAGDPAMRLQRRKLGIWSNETPDNVGMAERFKALVTGGLCGTSADGTTIYTISSDSARREEQGDALAIKMKEDGITTVTSSVGLPCWANCDRQRYFPENFLSASGVLTHDGVARLLLATNSKSQAANTFGIAFYATSPRGDWDKDRARRDVAPDYNGVVSDQQDGIFLSTQYPAWLVQQAGPYLTPQAMLRGAMGFPQISGSVNPNPWPGWKCCDPSAPMIRLDPSIGDFEAIGDAREVYWDDKAISKTDQKPGSFVCPDDNVCKRYAPGDWPAGEVARPVTSG